MERTTAAATAACGADDVASLAAAARDGDGAAFEALVKRFRDPVTGYATGLVRDRDLAEDVAQEAFLLALAGIRRLRDPRCFRGWLYRVVEHAAWTVRRRRAFRPLVPLRESECVVPSRDEPAVADRAAAAALEEAMERIPPSYAAALRLRYGRGLACPEVAEALGITLNNAKVRLHRAREALRRAAGASLAPDRAATRRAAPVPA